jgi:hypothetical protein
MALIFMAGLAFMGICTGFFFTVLFEPAEVVEEVKA